eukprot:3565302-Rhodomonas_salina.1
MPANAPCTAADATMLQKMRSDANAGIDRMYHSGVESRTVTCVMHRATNPRWCHKTAAPRQRPEPVSYTHLTLPTICSV